MRNKLSWEQIKAQYPEQWVSIFDLEFDEENQQIKYAKVYTASTELKEVTKKSKGVEFDSHTFRFTGSIKGFLGFSSS